MRSVLLSSFLLLGQVIAAQTYEQFYFSEGSEDVTLEVRVADEMWLVDHMDVGTRIFIDDDGSRFLIEPIEGWYRISGACGDYTGQTSCKATLTAIWATPPFVFASGTLLNVVCPKGTTIKARRLIP
ncbi:MAG: hypothetical protein IPK70_10260 [Flavobacteriales bacterium]|jgi:hypothetical protein|nr:hypothetical protein [Flavobacteriales bacterium]